MGENPIMKFFNYYHLPDDLHEISRQFYQLAIWIDQNLPDNAEKSTAILRKLLEAKDCAVRAKL